MNISEVESCLKFLADERQLYLWRRYNESGKEDGWGFSSVSRRPYEVWPTLEQAIRETLQELRISVESTRDSHLRGYQDFRQKSEVLRELLSKVTK